MKIRSYSELSDFFTFEDRFEYLKLNGNVGRETFGSDRYLNQRFYTSSLWKNVRDHVIARDYGRDLGVEGFDIHDRIYIHHMNPVTVEDLIHGNEDILNPDFLITTTHKTHNAIHYGDKSKLQSLPIERRPDDTLLWSRL